MGMGDYDSVLKICRECQQIRGIQGNDEESIQLYEKSLACHEKADKPNVAAIAKTEYELGVIYHKHKVSYSLEIATIICHEQDDSISSVQFVTWTKWSRKRFARAMDKLDFTTHMLTQGMLM